MSFIIKSAVFVFFSIFTPTCIWVKFPLQNNICFANNAQLCHQPQSVYLTTTTYARRSGPITNGMQSGRTAPQDSAFSSPTPAPLILEWPYQEEPRSGLIASAPVLDVSAPACTNGVWPPLRPVSVAQKNKPSTIVSSNVQSIDFPWTAWPDGSGRWDNWMVAQHLPRDQVQPGSGFNNSLKRRREEP